LQSAWESLSNGSGVFVEREQTFLRHASQELRTPITTISGNVSLMGRLALNDQQAGITNRIGRACHAMQTIVTTLLWLGREGRTAPEPEELRMNELLDNTIEKHRYLLAGKDVQLNTVLPDTVVSLPADPLGIVLVNLVRNSFQHTQAGDISIEIAPGSVCFRKRAHALDETPIVFEEDRGIGLSLVRRIAQRLTWRLSFAKPDGYVIVTLHFEP